MKDEEKALVSRTIGFRPWRGLIVPSVRNLLLALVYALFVRISMGAALHGDIGALIFAVQELSIVVLVLSRRRAYAAVDSDSSPAILAWCGTILPLFLRPFGLAPVSLAILGNALQLAGGLLVLVATLRLGRSFGIVAANRGIQTGGVYRIVRHPIYAAYVLAFGGFALAHPTLINGAILMAWLVVQVLRVRAEECLLMQDIQYAAYAAQVRYRLIPGWW